MTEITYRSVVPTSQILELAFAATRYNRAIYDKFVPGTQNVTKGGTIHITSDNPHFDEVKCDANEADYKYIDVPAVKDLVFFNLGIKAAWMNQAVTAETPISDEDRENAANAVEKFKMFATMNALKGRTMSDFDRKVIAEAEEEESTPGKVGILVYAAALFFKIDAMDAINEMIAALKLTSESLGTPKTKLALDITVFKSRYMDRFDKNIVNAHDADGNIVSFWSDLDFKVGQEYKITAKVKSSGEDQYLNNALVTQVNWVRKV